MTALYARGTQTGSAVLFGHIGRFIMITINAVSDWNNGRVTRNALSKLSDRELEDIGLCRGDIDLVSNG